MMRCSSTELATSAFKVATSTINRTRMRPFGTLWRRWEPQERRGLQERRVLPGQREPWGPRDRLARLGRLDLRAHKDSRGRGRGGRAQARNQSQGKRATRL